ncbi:NFU1 iron-sulfur cluster scaffold homolog, mitochondrial [Marchantia polymorpha subsp. ruderalis]|uniref:NIF system FeS cluster assembly NifU C-terminal domain-containing protein n=2 Tax=Marchantia polymorpha TaxID=3197 RepID=A0A176VPP8_MARPO|nr:hypothetical protein AXG93_3544s1000 [Marchantia polymorpha subsp. ruderalis]PTQ27621.1 hypothetical protein MARPO_0190s0016 [Marchantia polymorpha]BBN12453.1 hypothetical protein Mp_5g20200 [Marchantia polymorpha subsp. ruderalis]|eukprot:PTQ27621.1 hypothetical protein MARPO_0190s0016 [Marchantia polymorpha]
MEGLVYRQLCPPSAAAAATCCCCSTTTTTQLGFAHGLSARSLYRKLQRKSERPGGAKAASLIVRGEAQTQRQQLENLSGVVTDDAVPEGHKGLHGFLYGEGGADIHTSGIKEFAGRQGEDDGTTILGFEEYVAAREAVKFSGVYGVHNSNGGLEFVGYSRNVVLSLKTHRARVGAEKCASVRVKLFSVASIVSRAKLEEERKMWLMFAAEIPPGNSHENHLWEGSSAAAPLQHMTEEERKEYEEKKLKMRKAMGENLYDDVDGEDDDAKTIRMKLLQATEGDDWSSVIDGQTKQTIKPPPIAFDEVVDEAPAAQIVSPFSTSSKGSLYSADSYELTVENVDIVLNEVRPYLIADGGNVEVVSLTDGVVSLRLQGACGTCPSSTTTMKMGIERVLNEKFGESLKGVVQVDQQEIGATLGGVNSHLDMLRPAIINYGGSVEVVSVSPCRGEVVVKYKGPAPIGMGIQAAIKDKFPDIKTVTLIEP